MEHKIKYLYSTENNGKDLIGREAKFKKWFFMIDGKKWELFSQNCSERNNLKSRGVLVASVFFKCPNTTLGLSEFSKQVKINKKEEDKWLQYCYGLIPESDKDW